MGQYNLREKRGREKGKNEEEERRKHKDEGNIEV
jgi:hypothetical protein